MSPERLPQESNNFEFKYMPDSEQRRLLAKRTLELINLIDQQQVGNLFFLDKSARPLVTVFQDFWKKTHPNMPLPEIGFMQIGSETKERVVDEDNDDKESEFSEDSPFYYARDETQKIIANYGYEIHNLR